MFYSGRLTTWIGVLLDSGDSGVIKQPGMSLLITTVHHCTNSEELLHISECSLQLIMYYSFIHSFVYPFIQSLFIHSSVLFVR